MSNNKFISVLVESMFWHQYHYSNLVVKALGLLSNQMDDHGRLASGETRITGDWILYLNYSALFRAIFDVYSRSE